MTNKLTEQQLQEELLDEIGDFTKAMLKIVTITKELVNVFETEPILLNYLDTLQKLKDIEPLVLKYVMTSQSLYV